MQEKEVKCIPIKKRLVDYMSKWFSEFIFVGGDNQLYAFQKENVDGIYDYIFIQREFYQGKIILTITEVASCYNKSWKGIPWFNIGYSASIGALITGKNHYDANIGSHVCENNIYELDRLFDGLKKDINTYVIKFFAKQHNIINADKYMLITNSYMNEQFMVLSKSDVDLIKGYLINLNRAYSKYRNECRKDGKKEVISYFDSIPLHPIVEGWLKDIQEQLNLLKLSESMRTQLLKYITILFRDNYDFYNLR